MQFLQQLKWEKIMAHPMDAAQEEWRVSKSNLICKMLNCNCPGDEHGADPERAICFAAEKLIERMLAEYALQEQTNK